jgi:hypothetical protein
MLASYRLWVDRWFVAVMLSVVPAWVSGSGWCWQGEWLGS